MISMTGYAKKVFKIRNTSFFVLIRSLNSNKGLDMSIKTPRYLLDLEPDIKKILTSKLVRGKIDIKLSELSTNDSVDLNEKKVRSYIKILKKISPESDPTQLLNAAISLPDVFTSKYFNMTASLKKDFLKIINGVVSEIVKYREKEGRQMAKSIKKYINNILTQSKRLVQLEQQRTRIKKQKILDQLQSISKDVEYNPGRLESEMIYYFEKHDITEERVRLKYHCDFFLEILKSEKIVGRKLNFLSQEILREINTIGSKAHHFEIQKIVVQMKEDIDKTKEQLQNIL
ncbi:MAG: hypothetical protein CMD23_03875 [Flavobacteriales bacterium]|nr:hypothetical protein [Flavobacteriales bacterium]|tara:strand:+ start:612 stop:1472 length:861 start_codon:yes stop_codon:yes gene_type:complete